MKSALLAAVISLACTPALADPTRSTIFGAPDCGKWLNQPSEAKKAWLLGYLSGLNVLHFRYNNRQDPLDLLSSADQAFVWMDNFCKENPLRRVDGGGYELFLELQRRTPPQRQSN